MGAEPWIENATKQVSHRLYMPCLCWGTYSQVDIDQALEVEQDSQSPLPFLRSSRLTTVDSGLIDFAVKLCGSCHDRAAQASARTTPTRLWRVHAAWAFPHVTSPMTCAPKMKATSSVMPGLRLGSMIVGTASM